MSEHLAKMRDHAAARIPADTLSTMRQAIRDLAATGIVEESIDEGDRAPDFRLPNARGETVASAELLAKCPVVVSFYRGGW
ncbi:MAG: redoxin domain-containing protein, partial [Alphaproteobacteria bacterium]|nr:redoxin domain-containing protein [Alphaproteobacteria bacterium]